MFKVKESKVYLDKTLIIKPTNTKGERIMINEETERLTGVTQNQINEQGITFQEAL